MRPSSLLRQFGTAAEEATPSVSRFAPRNDPRIRIKDWRAMKPEHRPAQLLVHDVPRTTLPSDLLRRLKELEAVQRSFTIKDITSEPASFPRRPTLTKTYHLSFPTASLSQLAHRTLSKLPLFYSTILPRRTQHPDPSQPRKTRPSVEFTAENKADWQLSLIRHEELRLERRLGTTEAERGSPERIRFPTDGVMRFADGAAEESGKRVLIKGLPLNITHSIVRRIVGEEGPLKGEDGVVRLPPYLKKGGSIWLITLDSVASAYRVARKLNMTTKNAPDGNVALMRAEVQW